VKPIAWFWAGALVLVRVAVWAQDEAPARPTQPLDIRSDQLTVVQKDHRADFVGNVVAVQDDLTIRCEKLSVFYAAGKEEKEPSSGGISRMVFEGAVRIEQKLAAGPDTKAPGIRNGYCERAEYKKQSRRLVCTGNPWVSEDENKIYGERIVYRLDRRQVEVTKPRALLKVPEEAPAQPKQVSP
jgi:lipopolysaccharide transport protein LptA